MIKISRFEPSKDALKQKFNERIDQLIAKTGIGIFSSSDMIVSRQHLAAIDFDDYCRDSIDNSQVDEIWLNPNDIVKIEVRSIRDTEEKFLKIHMRNSDTYNVNGESVQEFFLKNVIFGNDI